MSHDEHIVPEDFQRDLASLIHSCEQLRAELREWYWSMLGSADESITEIVEIVAHSGCLRDGGATPALRRVGMLAMLGLSIICEQVSQEICEEDDELETRT